MRRTLAVLCGLGIVLAATGGVGLFSTAAAHTEENTANNQYKIHDQGVLTGYGGPVPPACSQFGRTDGVHECSVVRETVGSVNGVHDRAENPATGDNVFVPCGSQSVNTAGSDGPHHHVGSCVTYAIQLNGLNGQDDQQSEIDVDVDYGNINLRDWPATLYSADFDAYLYGPNGDMIAASEGPDNGHGLGPTEGGLAEGSYDVVVVARHGGPVGVSTSPAVNIGYETTITVTD